MGIPGRLNSEDAANNVQSCCTCKIRAHTLSQTHSQQPWFWKSKEFYWLELKTQSPSLSVDELKLSEPSTDSQDIILPQWPASIGLISYSNLFSQFHACCKPRGQISCWCFLAPPNVGWPWTTKQICIGTAWGIAPNILKSMNILYIYILCLLHLELINVGLLSWWQSFPFCSQQKQCQNLGSEPKEKRWSPPSSKGGIDCLWNQRP